MTKRPPGDDCSPSNHKKQKQKHDNHSRPQHKDQHHPPKPSQPSVSYTDALNQLPPAATTLGHIPSYTHFTVSPGLPPLPEVREGPLSTAPFRHKSTTSYNRSTTAADATYERLEFIGDAQLEHIASRLIYERFHHLPAGQQSQLREVLVKNETLAEYARAYGFDQRVQVGDMERMMQDTKDRGNKGFNKVLGDVFEAYVAAVVLTHHEDGFAVAEKWMTALWAPKLVEAAKSDRFYHPNLSLLNDGPVDPLQTYNPAAKADLQQRLMGPGIKLDYEAYKDPVELKGDQLGQNRHFIALYLTGFGYERKLLGKGEGKNKVEAGNWAATEAMYGKERKLFKECEEKMRVMREKRKAEREGKEVAKMKSGGDETK